MAVPPQPMWSIYIVETRGGHWYTGVTTDVARRVSQHQSGKGAKNLRGKGPLTLKYQRQVGSKSQALKLEWQLKADQNPKSPVCRVQWPTC